MSECEASCLSSGHVTSGMLGSEEGDVTGEDLGFEDGEAECGCEPCRRLADWDELVGVALPLMERLRPPRHDASVGTD